MPMALELPSKELTPQMERHSGVGGKGRRWCEGEKEWLAAVTKVVSSGLWNQELLFALCYAPALPPPQHPRLHPCSLPQTTSAPLWPGWNADFHPHPPPLHFSPLLLLQNRGNKGDAASPSCVTS
ncbi:hypothetical protein CesoFtcFv8_005269 [Champsocephalus esox]|uniref:Uncharacterized protein n=1 Tax=Champsocephalus esox TaxID=159716 RepID=A0AAN8H9I6_9TELE|nr:hypothetical protein CesoFtcFv8_005269 [Champsocephalus esox]